MWVNMTTEQGRFEDLRGELPGIKGFKASTGHNQRWGSVEQVRKKMENIRVWYGDVWCSCHSHNSSPHPPGFSSYV